MMELNREQIVKALECCSSDCPCRENCKCINSLLRDALALIRELTEENEMLRAKIVEEDRLLNDRVIESVNAVSKAHLRYTDALEEKLKTVKADTVKKMQERLKEKIHKSVYQYWNEGGGGYYLAEDVDDDIDQIAEELLEDAEG